MKRVLEIVMFALVTYGLLTLCSCTTDDIFMTQYERWQANSGRGDGESNLDYSSLNSREVNTTVTNVDPFTVCGGCSTEVYPDPINQPNAYIDENGIWHLEYYGATYSNWTVEYSGVSDTFKVNNIPTIRSTFITDWWYTLGTAGLMSSYYSPFGQWTQGFRRAIANTHVQLQIEINTDEVFNSSGAFTRDDELQGVPVSHSRDDNTTQVVLQHFREMENDTITLVYETEFAYDDESYRQVRIDSLKYVVNIIE